MRDDNEELMIDPETVGSRLSVNPENSILFFSNIDNGEDGRLYRDEDNKLSFSGNVEKSAEIFFDYICKLWNKEK